MLANKTYVCKNTKAYSILDTGYHDIALTLTTKLTSQAPAPEVGGCYKGKLLRSWRGLKHLQNSEFYTSEYWNNIQVNTLIHIKDRRQRQHGSGNTLNV